ncbi:MAG: hypothetical protein ABIH03_09030 [Pseudomonadota bacterium]
MTDAERDAVLTMIGREIAATHGALLALTSVLARQGDPMKIVEHLHVIRTDAAKEPNSSHFTDLIDKMIEVIRPALH